MFGDVAEREETGQAPKALASPRQDEVISERYRYRVTVPRNNDIFGAHPRKWTWGSWARRVEFEWILMARATDVVIWAVIGALAGVAAFGLPGVVISGYDFFIWQPLGAALGAAIGAASIWHRWRPVFRSHDDLL